MGQKYAAYNGGGAVVAFYDSVDSPVPGGVNAIAITDVQWQAAINTPGYTVVGGILTAPSNAVLLAAAQLIQTGLVRAATSSYLMSGFTSSALGSVHTYPSQDHDQRNLASALATGATTSIWAESGSTWALTSHTNAQLQQVNVDWNAYRLAAQTQYAALSAAIAAASTVGAVQAIVWTPPA